MKHVKWQGLTIVNDKEIKIKCDNQEFKGKKRLEYFDFSGSHFEICQRLFGSMDSDIREEIRHLFNVGGGYWPESYDPLGFAIKYFKKFHTRGAQIIDYREI
jgi:hypothetical protein